MAITEQAPLNVCKAYSVTTSLHHCLPEGTEPDDMDLLPEVPHPAPPHGQSDLLELQIVLILPGQWKKRYESGW